MLASVALTGTLQVESESMLTPQQVAEFHQTDIDCVIDVGAAEINQYLTESLSLMLSSDRPDGLWPTLITDELGTALGLAYSNRESLQHAIQTRTGVYWSRSRDELWFKGKSSGATQELLGIALDCDSDCLRFCVRQQPPGFCHRETYTCFGAERNIQAVIARLSDRILGEDKKSFTRKLANDAPGVGVQTPGRSKRTCRCHVARRYYLGSRRCSLFFVGEVGQFGRRPGRSLSRTRQKDESGCSPPQQVGSREESMTEPIRIIRSSDFKPAAINRSIDAETMRMTQAIVDDVRANGESAVRQYAERFGERVADQPLWLETCGAEGGDQPNFCHRSRTPGTRRQQDWRLRKRASRLFTAPDDNGSRWTSRAYDRTAGASGLLRAGRTISVAFDGFDDCSHGAVAGCSHIVVATPNPSDLMLAAASIAGAERVLAVGGAQAIAALAYGIGNTPACDLICGPGSRWVTAAKKIVNGDCGIDMLAGPSELVIVADQYADRTTVAADLLAQAEHDTDARPILIALSDAVADKVGVALQTQLADLPTAEIARQSLAKSAIIVATSIDEAVEIANDLAPEHLELHCRNGSEVAGRIRNAGCIFVGHDSAEVFGDYGVGPNHTLPTGGTARWSAGLNVFMFLRVRTWLKWMPRRRT